MASQFSSLQTPKKRPNYSGPSDIAPSGLMQSPHQLYMGSEFQNTSPFSVLGHGAPVMNVPRVSELAPSFASPYLTGSASESDPTGNVMIFSLPPHPYYGCQMVPNGDNHGEIPVTDIENGHGIVPLSNMDPPFPAQASLSYTPSAYPPNGSIPGAHHWYHTTRPSESAGDAPGSASPTALQHPHGQRSSLFQTFIDDNPLLNKAYDMAKGRVASYSILKASEARRQNPAPFICEYCQATFTRSHNLSYHRDAHLRIKRHRSLCGKKFGTPSGTKRHEDNCSKCKGASRDTLSPG